MKQVVDDARKTNPLGRVFLAKGAETNTGNLQRVLDMLWVLADKKGYVPTKALGDSVRLFWEYLRELGTRKCLGFVHSTVGVETIILKERGVSERADLAMGNVTPTMDTASQHCLVFVDAPNLCNKMHMGEYGRMTKSDEINFFRAAWEELPKITAELTGIPREHQTCFLYTTITLFQEKNKRFKTNLTALSDTLLEKDGIRVIVRRDKDIDPVLERDMIFETLEQIERGNNVHVVLFSGDGDHSYAVDGLRTYLQRRGVHVPVTAINWNGLQSKEIEKVADKTYAINHFHARIDPHGVQRRLGEGAQREIA